MDKFCNEFLDFINKSYCNYYAVENIKNKLNSNGFIKLNERDSWNIEKGGKYYVERNNSGIIAFKVNDGNYFNIVASHTDSPALKIKENSVEGFKGGFQCDVETYGGLIYSTWLDRPLSMAGKVALSDGREQLINFEQPLFIIPNLAIHLNREVNSGYKYTATKDLCPICIDNNKNIDGNYILNIIAKKLNISAEDILAYDLNLYEYSPGNFIGLKGEGISASRLDDLAMVYCSLEGFCQCEDKGIQVLACVDNEEIGSNTLTGADSTFIERTLERIVYGLGNDKESFYRYCADSVLLSADMAHAYHHSHEEQYDRSNKSYINNGVVIKTAASQSYANCCGGTALFKTLCLEQKINFQQFTNHSDKKGGATIGSVLASRLGMTTIDMGIPLMAMHSIREIVGTKDCYDCYKLFKAFYNRNV